MKDYDAQGIIQYTRLRDWPEDQVPPKKPVPVIPWVNRNDDSWENGEPIFRVSHPETGMTASGWIGITDDHFMFRVVVREEKFVKAQGDGKIEGATKADGLAAWQSRMIWDCLKKQKRRRPSEFFYIKVGTAARSASKVRLP